jgi:hypothetical protein
MRKLPRFTRMYINMSMPGFCFGAVLAVAENSSSTKTRTRSTLLCVRTLHPGNANIARKNAIYTWR